MAIIPTSFYTIFSLASNYAHSTQHCCSLPPPF